MDQQINVVEGFEETYNIDVAQEEEEATANMLNTTITFGPNERKLLIYIRVLLVFCTTAQGLLFPFVLRSNITLFCVQNIIS